MNPVPPQTRIRMMTSHFSDHRNIRSAFALGAAVGGGPERMKRCTLAPRRNTLSSVEGTGAASRRSRCPAIPSGAMSRARGPGCRAIPPRSRARRSGRAASARWDRIRAACARARWCAAVPRRRRRCRSSRAGRRAGGCCGSAPVQQFLEAVADIGARGVQGVGDFLGVQRPAVEKSSAWICATVRFTPQLLPMSPQWRMKRCAMGVSFMTPVSSA